MSLKVVFMGTPDFAVSSLDSIVKAGHNVLAVVAQPDKPKGRGMKLVSPPVKDYALNAGIEVLQPVSIRKEDFINQLRDLNTDIIVVVAYGKILPKAILDLPRYGCVNVHASLLPKYRGAAPIQWSIVNGEKVTGITTMYMDEGLDTGDMILKKEVIIDEDDTAQTLHDKLAVEGGKALVETLKLIEKDKAPRIKQSGEATYAPILKKEDGLIDWNKPAAVIRNLIRGLYPWPCAFTYLNNTLIKIYRVKITDEVSPAESGTIITGNHKQGLKVSSGSKVLKVEELQPEGGRRMTAEEYLIGHMIGSGEKFTTGRR